MTDEHALLAAIAANPDDDTVRLAYADWLDEQGGEVNVARAEYIRIQIRRHQWPDEPTDSARESQLYLAYCGHWRRPIPGYEVSLAHRRGFPCCATATASAILAAADNPLARIIEELTVYLDGAEAWRPVLRDRLLSGVRQLVLRRNEDTLWPGWDARFFRDFDFPRLGRLSLERMGVDDRDIAWLCGATGFPRLEELDLRNNAITDDMADPLTVAPITRRLRRLRLAGNPRIGADGVARLTARFGSIVDFT